MFKLSLLEFHLLLENEHPLFDASQNDQFLETGKGADVHYTRNVICKENNKVLSITFTFNHSLGCYQDWIRDGDFELDLNKQDDYDKYGKPVVFTEEPIVEVFVCPIDESYEKMLSENNLLDHKTNSEWQTAPPDEMTELFMKVKTFQDKKINNIENEFKNLGKSFKKLATKYKFNADRVWVEIFNNISLVKLSEKDFFELYRVQHELLIKGTATYTFGDQKVELTEKDIKALNKKTEIFKTFRNKIKFVK